MYLEIACYLDLLGSTWTATNILHRQWGTCRRSVFQLHRYIPRWHLHISPFYHNEWTFSAMENLSHSLCKFFLKVFRKDVARPRYTNSSTPPQPHNLWNEDRVQPTPRSIHHDGMHNNMQITQKTIPDKVEVLSLQLAKSYIVSPQPCTKPRFTNFITNSTTLYNHDNSSHYLQKRNDFLRVR